VRLLESFPKMYNTWVWDPWMGLKSLWWWGGVVTILSAKSKSFDFGLGLWFDNYQCCTDHRATMVKGDAELEMCDDSVMNWAPPGCQDLGLCQIAPKSKPYKCFWPH